MTDSLVLVTGGAGFIGSHTVDELIANGWSVRVIDNLQVRVHPKGKPDWVQDCVDFIQGDVSNRTDMERALDGVSHVFHFAAYQDYLSDFSSFIHVNAESTALMFELIADRKLPIQKMVFASSQAVSGEGSYRCVEHGLFVPNARPLDQLVKGKWDLDCPKCGGLMEPQLIDENIVNPGTVYGIAKYATEMLADRLGRRYNIPTVCMRYTYVQGIRNSFYNMYSGIARIFATRLMNGLPPVCFEDGQQLRDYVNVHDVARANILVLDDKRSNFQVYNVGGGRPITVREFADLMLKQFNSALKPEIPGLFRVGDTRHTISNISKLRELGWEPNVPVEDNVAQYVQWLEGQLIDKEYLLEAEKTMMGLGILRQGAP